MLKVLSFQFAKLGSTALIAKLGSTRNVVTLVRPWIKYFTTIVTACSFEQAAKLTLGKEIRKINSKFKK